MMIGMLAMPTLADKQKTSELPDMAFLEFLADMQEIDGQLVAPTDLLDAQQQLNANKNTTTHVDAQSVSDGQSLSEMSALAELFQLLGSEELTQKDLPQKDLVQRNSESSKEEGEQ